MDVGKYNLLEYGNYQQYKLVRKYIEQAGELYVQSPDFIEDFINLLERAITEISEKEEIPSWVFNYDQYREKSEIVIACAMLKQMEFEKKIKEDPSAIEPFNTLQRALYKICKRKNWDVSIFRHQIFHLFSNSSDTNYILDLSRPSVTEGIDLN